MSIKVSVASKILGLNAQLDVLNGGSMKIYSGVRPATPDTALSGNTLAATLPLNATAFAGASAAGSVVTKTANAITSDSDADATVTAAWFRCVKSDGTTAVIDGDCSVAGGGGDAILDSLSVVQHTTVACTSMVLTAGG